MTAPVTIKQGTSLIALVAITDDAGTALDVTGFAITGQVRDANANLVANLPITVTPHLGLAQINVPDTSAWPLGTLRCDLRVVTATGAILQTQTFPVVVQRRVTTP